MRLDFIDGLRAAMACYVVLTHAYNYSGITSQADTVLPALQSYASCLTQGRYAVDVFIVISGFCLMQGAMSRGSGSPRLDVARYLLRRARRILPPYYAALGLALAVVLSVPGMDAPSGRQWDVSLPATTPDVLASHLLLLHNLRPEWAYKVNGALWTVATEWQIYFLFPLLLLLWNRAGALVTVAAACVLGYLGHRALGGRIDSAAPWYLGLFAMGMAAAALGVRRPRRPPDGGTCLRWCALCTVPLLVTLAAPVVPRLEWARPLWVGDMLIGAGAALFLVYGTRDALHDTALPPAPLALLTCPTAVGIGRFSYSLYLVHVPVIALMDLYLHWMPVAVRLVVYVTAALPLSIALAYPFYLAFERPFQTSRFRSA